MRDITPLIAPRSIAVIGASSNPTKSGGVLFGNLARGRFAGALYPINPNAAEIMGRKAYPSLADVPEKVDLVYIVLPSHHVETAIKQCVEAGARAACIITAGFAESGPDGAAVQERIRDFARAAGLLLAGPNTIGMINADCGMMGSFVNFPHWKTGKISLFTQTGIFTGALMLQVMTSDVQRPAISKSIDVGNKIDVDEIDFLDFAASDPNTQVIGFYIESIRNLRLFLEKAAALRQDKPIVVLNPGRTPEGKSASAAHTGSPPSDHEAIDKAMRQHGILTAEDEDDFLNALRVLSMLPKPRGKRVGIATTSGALGVIATDLVAAAGLELAQFEPQTLDAMRSILPEWLTPTNPFDFWIGIDVRGPKEAHEIGLRAIISDPNCDMILCTLLAPPNADFPEFGALMRELRSRYSKPIVLVPYGSAAGRWTKDVEGADIPVFSTVRAGVRALSMLGQLAAR